jgi:hypothetical protein
MKTHKLTKTISILVFLFSFNFFSPQVKSEDSRLSNFWVLKKIDWKTYSFFFEKQKNFRENRIGFKFKKNGKIISKNTPIRCMVGEKNIKLKRYKGNWKKVSDSIINIQFPFTNGIRGYHIIKKIDDHELVLRKNIKLPLQ